CNYCDCAFFVSYCADFCSFFFFFFIDPATTAIYTLSLHDALPISGGCQVWLLGVRTGEHPAGLPLACLEFDPQAWDVVADEHAKDRKSTRLNSSHDQISYAVFCLKKKKNKNKNETSDKNSVRHQRI